MPFSTLGLTDRLVQGILATGYTAPTEIQSRAIPAGLSGKDIIGLAQTGTGKTAAFVLPILNRLSSHHHTSRHIRALVLTPTRELAQQVEDFIVGYGRFTEVKSLSVYGGVPISGQLKHLSRGVDILIATPGRLLDHLERRSVDLSKVEVLVLDEADRMFDMGFIDAVRSIIAKVPNQRQTMLFSATMSKEIKALTASIQHHPEVIEVGERRDPAQGVRQHCYSVQPEMKIDLLFHILQSKEMDSVLIFSRTKHGADKISHKLERGGIKSVAIHSNRTQAQRQQALAGFKQRHYRVLVATDIAARGIDVEGISHVVNFDTPTFAEDYVHRIGRTGRAAATGDAITFVSREEQKHLRKIEHFIGKRFDLKRYPGFDYTKKPTVAATSQPSRREAPRHEGPRNQGPRNQGNRRQTPQHQGPRHQASGNQGQKRRHNGERQFARPVMRPHDEEKRVLYAPAPTKSSDWKSLIDAAETKSGKFRKKLKRIFKHD
ncbi:MAG: DEAD/DEAH box helicase [Bacteroidota bacterium]